MENIERTSPVKPTVAFIGLGLMGAPMAHRLHGAGYPLRLYNRTESKCAPLGDLGATVCASPSEAVRQAEILITMVTNDDALRDISDAVLPAMRRGSIHIDCSTVSPSLTSALESEYAPRQLGFLHSPVLGSIPQATDGSLLLFVGGEDSLFSRVEPLLRILGMKLWRFPTAAQATNMKLIMNSFIGGMIATLSQALQYGRHVSVDGTVILDVLAHSSLNSTMYQTKGKSILEENYTPRFFLENLRKDINLFRATAETVKAVSPVADAVTVLLEAAIARGYSREDYSAIAKVFDRRP